MNTVFMNSKNSETSDPHRLLLNLTDKTNLRSSDKYVALSNLSINYTWENIKKLYKNNKFKISAPSWNKELELPDGKHGEKNDNPSIRIYINKIENKIIFKIKTGYYLELLTPEIMNLFGSTKTKISNDKNGKNVPYLEITEVVLVHCNTVNNDYQQDSRVLYTFVPNKLFRQLLDISPKNLIFFKKLSIQNFYILKYGLLIKILNL